MMNFEARGGVYPTMITPYKDGEIDYEAVENLVEWYWKKGCDGIFAACQSSEIMYLTLDERVKLTRTVIAKAKALAEADRTRPPMMIVASGHVSDRFEEQVRELNAIAAEKPDAVILITNRMDIANTTDEKWIEETEKLIAELPADMPLGVYECPKPYKRSLSEKMIKWCADNGRFYFMKDTCGDLKTLRRRIEICKNSHLKIFNANAQTMLQSARDGAFGYCGVMANFHPQLFSRLLNADTLNDQKTELLQLYLTHAALVEFYLVYPCIAKYHLDRYEGVSMSTYARSADHTLLTDYQKYCMDQFAALSKYVEEHL